MFGVDKSYLHLLFNCWPCRDELSLLRNFFYCPPFYCAGNGKFQQWKYKVNVYFWKIFLWMHFCAFKKVAIPIHNKKLTSLHLAWYLTRLVYSEKLPHAQICEECTAHISMYVILWLTANEQWIHKSASVKAMATVMVY